MKTFKVNDTLWIEVHSASTSLPVRHLVIRFAEHRPFDVIYPAEVKDLIVQLIEATIYLVSEGVG
jgi:hypothetical protein